MSETMQQRAPRPNDDAWALAIGLGVVALALFGLAGAQPLGWAARFEEWVIPAKAVRPVAWEVPGWLSLVATIAAVSAVLTARLAALGRPLAASLGASLAVVLLGLGAYLLGHQACVAATDDRKFILPFRLGLTGEAGYLVALAAGLVLGNLFPRAAIAIAPAARTELFIKTAIVLVGVSLAAKTLGQQAAASRVLLRGVAAIAEAYLLYWGLVYLLARTVFRFPREWSAPLASGISICGVSAAMATGAAIRARSGVAVLVSSLVVVFSTIELVVLPFLARWLLPEHPMVAAAWMGLAVKTDGAAVAAGAVTEALYQPGPGNLMVATTTLIKVFIDLFIGVWCFVLAVAWQRWFRPEPADKVRWMEIIERMPLFLVGYFLAFLGLMFLGNQWPATLGGIKLVEGQTEAFRKPLFALAFLSIGMATDLRRLASPGMGRLVLVYLVSIFGFIIWMALAISWIFFHDIPALPVPVTP